MNSLGHIEKAFGTPEREHKTSEETAWDSLTELPKLETWDEHLEKAKQLLNPLESLTRTETNQLLDYGDRARHNKKVFFQDLAQQEKLEREFNSELSHVEDLDLLAEAKDPRVEKTNIKYQEQDIPVYILKDYPLKFLAHIINYREGDYISQSSAKLADELINNPKKWSEPFHPPEPGVEKSTIYGSDPTSNTLSTSYANGTLQSFDHDLAHSNGTHHKSIIYGFDHIRPTSLIYAKAADGRIPNHIEQGPSLQDRPIWALAPNLEQLDTSKGKDFSSYNEVAMLRYDEKGEPLRPSFIVTDNKSILLNTESMPEEETLSSGVGEYQQRTNAFYMNRIKQHAAEHDIPIILIDRSTYKTEGSRNSTNTPIDDFIAKHSSEVLAAGMNHDLVKSKLSAEEIWQNYDSLKQYIPDLNVETEFNNLVNERYANALKKVGDTPTDADQKQTYNDVVTDIIYGSDAYDYLEKGGSDQLLEISRKTGDEETVKYAQELLKYTPKSFE